uniref:Uncharacterized protein n=1 Tax=Rhipicephalus zambeziensis TaxID=60191 RepID=A0A224YGX3_9ACAR
MFTCLCDHWYHSIALCLFSIIRVSQKTYICWNTEMQRASALQFLGLLHVTFSRFHSFSCSHPIDPSDNVGGAPRPWWKESKLGDSMQKALTRQPFVKPSLSPFLSKIDPTCDLAQQARPSVLVTR